MYNPMDKLGRWQNSCNGLLIFNSCCSVVSQEEASEPAPPSGQDTKQYQPLEEIAGINSILNYLKDTRSWSPSYPSLIRNLTPTKEDGSWQINSWLPQTQPSSSPIVAAMSNLVFCESRLTECQAGSHDKVKILFHQFQENLPKAVHIYVGQTRKYI